LRVRCPRVRETPEPWFRTWKGASASRPSAMPIQVRFVLHFSFTGGRRAARPCVGIPSETQTSKVRALLRCWASTLSLVRWQGCWQGWASTRSRSRLTRCSSQTPPSPKQSRLCDLHGRRWKAWGLNLSACSSSSGFSRSHPARSTSSRLKLSRRKRDTSRRRYVRWQDVQ
jgi:hypothetical protein